MNRKTKRGTETKRLSEQITTLFGWIKEQARSNPLPSLLVAILFVLLAWITWETYRRNNLGLGEKTYWDWMELLVIPVVLATGAWWLNKSERENEREIAEKNRKEDREIADERRNQSTLEAYFDRMVELLLEHDLMDNESEREVLSTIARTRTLAVLRSLDGRRKGHVVQFLYESGLIGPDRVVVNLRGADLRGANLIGANLARANLEHSNIVRAALCGADLSKADLNEADLTEADLTGACLVQTKLRGANLRRANLHRARLSKADLVWANLQRAYLDETYLTEADLHGTDLTKADLYRALVTDQQLAQAKSLKGAIMPDGTKHD
jgi:uncharacterized protein YjbI with pentapeptide repeats